MGVLDSSLSRGNKAYIVILVSRRMSYFPQDSDHALPTSGFHEVFDVWYVANDPDPSVSNVRSCEAEPKHEVVLIG